jgi:transposase
MVKQAGLGKQGHSRTVEENARALLHIHQNQQSGLSFDQAIKATAAAELTSHTTLRAVIKEFQTDGTITPPNTAERGRGNPDHPLHDANGPTLQAELLMHEELCKQNTADVAVTSATLAAELRDKLKISVNRSTVRRWLHQLGYSWRHKRYVGGMKPQAKNARIRQFILEYADALAEEAAGRAVIVYVDESYIHTHHAAKKGWFHPSNPDVIGDNDGKRLIILHAMTEGGLLAVPGEGPDATNWLSEAALTCEVVFEEILEDGQDDSDYHNTMTGSKFTAWVKSRLLPTFAHMHPGKKMFLVMDNASYHKPRDDTWISDSQAQNKHDLAHTLIDLGVESLVRSRDGRRVPSHLFDATVGQGGASKQDLVAAVKQWLSDHPDSNRTVVEQLLDDAGHSIVFTPPYCPSVQPIELLWAYVKRQVASQSTVGRTMTQTREQTEAAFESIRWTFCNSVVKHCHDWIDAFLKTDAAEDLSQCGTLAGVIKHHQLITVANATASAASSDIAPVDINPLQSPIAVPAASSSSSSRGLRPRH